MGCGRLKCFIELLNSNKNVTIFFLVSKNPYLHLYKYGVRDYKKRACSKRHVVMKIKNANMFNFVQYGLKYKQTKRT